MGRSLKGSRVLLLGGSSGIGLATAQAAAAAGATVTVASRSSDKVNAAVAKVGTGAAGVPLDTTINAALESLGRGLALSLSPVRVNTVSPGLIDTPIRAAMPADKKQAMLDHAAATLPARRVGQAEDVAAAILMVMTNPFTTGSTLFIDGGGMIS